MNLPGSLFEAVVKGFAGTGEVRDRRALFLFLVDHSDAMQKVFSETGRSRIASVAEALNEMKSEMAKVDCGEHLDIGFMGYPIRNGGGATGAMWSDGTERGVIRSVSDAARIEAGKPDATAVDGARGALEAARELVSAWVKRNERPLFNPVVIHIVAAENPVIPGIESPVRALTTANETYLFHCCFDDHSPDNIVIPSQAEVPPGLASQLFAVSSEMPPLVEDVGELLRGRVSPRLRQMAEDLARSYGMPRELASVGADLLGGLLGGGMRLPTGVVLGRTTSVEARVEGLRINSRTGFALVKGMVGFRIFTRLFN
jgi:hypothetical protein